MNSEEASKVEAALTSLKIQFTHSITIVSSMAIDDVGPSVASTTVVVLSISDGKSGNLEMLHEDEDGARFIWLWESKLPKSVESEEHELVEAGLELGDGKR